MNKKYLRHFMCPVCENEPRVVVFNKVKATCFNTKCQRVYKRIVGIVYKTKEQKK